MDLVKLIDIYQVRRDLALCWLAETFVHVLERVATHFHIDCYTLVSVGDTTIAQYASVLSELITAFLHRDEAKYLIGNGRYTHVNKIDTLLQLVLNQSSYNSISSIRVLFVVHELCKVKDRLTTKLQKASNGNVLLIMLDSGELLEFVTNTRMMASSTMFHSEYFCAADCSFHSDWQQSLSFIAQPLDCFRFQNGWKIMLEILSWMSDLDQRHTLQKEHLKAPQTTMISKTKGMPFQLLLLFLRWSHFHPEMVRVCSKRFGRQVQLIPQERIRCELVELQMQDEQIWTGLYPPIQSPTNVQPKQEHAVSSLFLDASSCAWQHVPNLARLSQCSLWSTQKTFYKSQGIRAWSSGKVPFGVSSSSFLAAAYARIAADFLLSNADSVKPSLRPNDAPNCFVWEAASGSCKFLHSFMLHFTELVEKLVEFKQRQLVPLVIATDLSEQILTSRSQMECFRTYIERGQLDFALFDTDEFVQRRFCDFEKRNTLKLMHSQRLWRIRSEGPVILIGNYFLDSLRADVYTVAIKQDCSPVISTDEVGYNVGIHDDRIAIQAALLDEKTSNSANMDIHLCPLNDAQTQAIYKDDRLNATFLKILKQYQSCEHKSSGLILFPVGALEFFLSLLDQDVEAATFPVAILGGDARFSFRDAISSAYVGTKTAYTPKGFNGVLRLVLPQLSPTPDCFCLPIDFEILDIFFKYLNSSNTGVSAISKSISAPASDTFSVFFAIIEQQSTKKDIDVRDAKFKALHLSFRDQFARFTPGDCDLMWGMMSFDNGARYFSVSTLVGLLAECGWDFDLFAILQWELLKRMTGKENHELVDYQSVLIDAGMKSWRTFYHMEQQTEMDGIVRIARLQLARWFYVLKAYDKVLELLGPWLALAPMSTSANDMSVFYLLGLTSLQMDKYWSALSFFQLCARFAPTKEKFKRRIASTVLHCQTYTTVL
ncbi:uncharacterized protein PHALS_00652 [Plasmopara halstedii]|uniref:Tetratricopeptide-like helical n=1 Tax=Plasmopara halstedii TaxID=4781 RepID=A0A0P1B7I1_PLAHL|nr:uncharacterized protein PHALS_00652 [Plasmopara halstedii]CEG50514.1 hypothetical protein PHALS_00652 [Plasmopara halstedii]|eukprot:XP_024586883.1 hypothetical protein PHALS_00652 [Plasmopara halstedii]